MTAGLPAGFSEVSQLTLAGMALRLRRPSNWRSWRRELLVRLYLIPLILSLISTLLEKSSKERAQYWLQPPLHVWKQV